MLELLLFAVVIDADGIVLIIAALAALATALVPLMIAFKQIPEIKKEAAIREKAADAKADVLIAKAEEIHTLTNSNFTEQKEKVASLENMVKALQEYILKQQIPQGDAPEPVL